MPRHNYSKKHTPAQRAVPQPEQGKVRYATKHKAEQAIKESQQYNPDVSLSVYQSPSDGGWYLTSR